nr:SCP2 sterol-binding domain-containing protein [Azorhizobium doebereinerae]
MPASETAIPTVPPFLSSLMRPLPLLPLQPVLAVLISRIRRHHPQIFERLGAHADKSFGIDPTDLPFAFVLTPHPNSPAVSAVRALPASLNVRIAGPLAGLIGLVEGDFDGDALFFSRDLRVDGDVEAVLALRNAIDDAEIDLVGEVVRGLGPLKAPAERALRSLLRPPRRAAGPEAGATSWN